MEILGQNLKPWVVKISAGIVLAELVNQAYKVLKLLTRAGTEEVTEVYFFPEDSTKTFKTKNYLGEKILQGGGVVLDQESHLAHILHYVRKAERSVDVCLYIFTCPEFGNVLLECLTRGITVRVIVDFTSIQENGQEVNRLRRHGVPLRGKKQEHHMHHKFVVIDSTLLLNGSFNWTQTAVTGNNENVMIMSNKFLVDSFLSEFNKLWDLHKYP